MNYLSVCSGIEAATVAWHPLGWKAVAFGEIERFPCQVLEHHYPETPNWGDMTKFKEWPDADVNVFVGGTPCQSFSVAGLRKGLDDPRGNLMLTYLAIAARYRPQWLVWENVPGVLSSNGGLDFASLLRGMGELGYGFAYRILDAQYFGVAQRRRRVFVVGYLGNWRPAAAVLFERHSLSGNPAPSRKARQVTPTLTKEGTGISRTEHNEDGWYVETPLNSVGSLCARTGLSNSVQDGEQGHLMPTWWNGGDIAATLTTKSDDQRMPDKDNAQLILQPAYGIPGNWIGRKPENGGNATEPMHDIAPCLTKTDQHGVAHSIGTDIYNGAITGDIAVPLTNRSDGTGTGPTVMQPTIVHGTQDPCTSDIAFAQGRNNGGENVMVQAMAVRRLTPVECERLQGFPDNYTDIKPKGKQTPDGPRYKALGNSMAVPVMAWIGKRIQEVDAICQTQKQ